VSVKACVDARLAGAPQKRPITVSKETYYSVKRDLLQCQKRPTTVSKETYYSVKRDLLQCQKRPITVSKEGLLTLVWTPGWQELLIVVFSVGILFPFLFLAVLYTYVYV
jgi:hypothetical protein